MEHDSKGTKCRYDAYPSVMQPYRRPTTDSNSAEIFWSETSHSTKYTGHTPQTSSTRHFPRPPTHQMNLLERFRWQRLTYRTCACHSAPSYHHSPPSGGFASPPTARYKSYWKRAEAMDPYVLAG